MAWPAVVKGILSIVSLLGNKDKDGEKKGDVSTLLRISDLIGNMSNQQGIDDKKEEYEEYARNPTFKSFLSSGRYDNQNYGGMR